MHNFLFDGKSNVCLTFLHFKDICRKMCMKHALTWCIRQGQLLMCKSKALTSIFIFHEIVMFATYFTISKTSAIEMCMTLTLFFRYRNKGSENMPIACQYVTFYLMTIIDTISKISVVNLGMTFTLSFKMGQDQKYTCQWTAQTWLANWWQ